MCLSLRIKTSSMMVLLCLHFSSLSRLPAPSSFGWCQTHSSVPCTPSTTYVKQTPKLTWYALLLSSSSSSSSLMSSTWTMTPPLATTCWALFWLHLSRWPRHKHTVFLASKEGERRRFRRISRPPSLATSCWQVAFLCEDRLIRARIA